MDECVECFEKYKIRDCSHCPIWEETMLYDIGEDDPCTPFPGEFGEDDEKMLKKLIDEAKAKEKANQKIQTVPSGC